MMSPGDILFGFILNSHSFSLSLFVFYFFVIRLFFFAHCLYKTEWAYVTEVYTTLSFFLSFWLVIPFFFFPLPLVVSIFIFFSSFFLLVTLLSLSHYSPFFAPSHCLYKTEQAHSLILVVFSFLSFSFLLIIVCYKYLKDGETRPCRCCGKTSSKNHPSNWEQNH